MSTQREELARTYFGALQGGGIEDALSLATDDVVLDLRNSNAPWRGIAAGRGGVAQTLAAVLAEWANSIDDFHWETLGMRGVGRDTVVVQTRLSGRGHTSGVEIDAHGGWLARFEGELLAEAILYQSFDDALLAARRRSLATARLYFVCDALPRGRDPAPLLEAAIRGGVDVIQLREKAPRCAEELIAFAEPFARVAGEHRVLFFLNDEPELVEACGADGVHVGQDDAPVAEARQKAGPASLVGLSTHTPEQFDAAVAAVGPARPDQISAGPIWETPTKAGRAPAGLGLIEHAARAGVDAPWFAIGGINASSIGEVVAAGARRVVVVRAIRDAADPETAARALCAALERPRA